MIDPSSVDLQTAKDCVETIAQIPALMDRIDRFFGTLNRPIGRVVMAYADSKAKVIEAKGDAKAKKIEAESEIEMQELRARAATRISSQALREQSNIESTVEQAKPLLTDKAQPEMLEDDFLAAFFD